MQSASGSVTGHQQVFFLGSSWGQHSLHLDPGFSWWKGWFSCFPSHFLPLATWDPACCERRLYLAALRWTFTSANSHLTIDIILAQFIHIYIYMYIYNYIYILCSDIHSNLNTNVSNFISFRHMWYLAESVWVCIFKEFDPYASIIINMWSDTQLIPTINGQIPNFW